MHGEAHSEYGSMASDTAPQERIERITQVSFRTGLSERTIYRLEAAGKFPKKRRLSANAIGFLASEVDAWIANLETV